MIAYKLFRIKRDGNLYPLFINRNVPTVLGKWLQSECYPTKGFAIRQGWHCCLKPFAPHLKERLSSGEVRRWVECEIEDYVFYNRPESQGGKWVLANRIKVNRILSEIEVNRILGGNTNV